MALLERERQLCEAQILARIGNWVANMATGELHWSDEIYRIFGHKPLATLIPGWSFLLSGIITQFIFDGLRNRR